MTPNDTRSTHSSGDHPGNDSHQAGAHANGDHSARGPTKRKWLRRALKVAAALVLLALGGFLFAASGIMPIKASSGHWAITAWFLNFSMGRSVSTHSMGTEVPPLDEPWLVPKGAAYYDIGCFPCHGSPELEQPRVAAAMTPHPPYLPPKISEWNDAKLFYITKHGVKFTGMPAWPSQQRDDEVWAMVAFLRMLPELDVAEYRRQVGRGEAIAGSALEQLPGSTSRPSESLLAVCARCHGHDGEGRGAGAFPRLGGQSPEYLEASLEAFANGERHSGIMQPVAAGLDAEARREIARHYSALKDVPSSQDEGSQDETAAELERGKQIVLEGIPEANVPACIDCHGPREAPRKAVYPRLAGLDANYITLQVGLFKERSRGGTPFAHVMHPIADRLPMEGARAVAAYYESLGREGDGGGE